MKVLILGAFGFVGKHLIDYINENYDWKIIATKRKDQQVKIENIDVVELDITSFTQVKKIIADYQPNYIINLAAQSSVRFSWENPQRTVEVNLIGTLNILESVRLYSPRTKILLIGSSEEYGQSIK
jgi:GDP-4-dehydro-6-deoxy-D-mannose reductase